VEVSHKALSRILRAGTHFFVLPPRGRALIHGKLFKDWPERERGHEIQRTGQQGGSGKKHAE
jgi:hypothetical protein